MTARDWKVKIIDAVDSIRTRYELIGRKTGAPFIAILYPSETEKAVLDEWRIQTETLRPHYDVVHIDVLEVTHKVFSDIGIDNVVDVIKDPMPGADSSNELGQAIIQGLLKEIKNQLAKCKIGKPVVSLERLAALYPAIGPRAIMQVLWDSPNFEFEGPIIFMIPGIVKGLRTYAFLDCREEFMYRGELL